MMTRTMLVAWIVLLPLIGCAWVYPHKTPEGVNVVPILSVKVSNDFHQIAKVKILLPKALLPSETDNQNPLFTPDPNVVVFNRKSDDAQTTEIFRSFEFHQFDNSEAARLAYLAHKRQFTDQEYDWRLFKEEGTPENMYFSAYRAPWMDTNHGVPTGHIVNHPEILIAFLKRNLLIVVSYISYRNEGDYVQQINEDISYISDLLRKVVSAPPEVNFRPEQK
jgi:hypothetical protein